jgi:hypothetical protein
MVCKPAWNLISQWLRNEFDTGKLAAWFCTINVPLQQRPIFCCLLSAKEGTGDGRAVLLQER